MRRSAFTPEPACCADTGERLEAIGQCGSRWPASSVRTFLGLQSSASLQAEDVPFPGLELPGAGEGQ